MTLNLNDNYLVNVDIVQTQVSLNDVKRRFGELASR